MDSSRLFCSSSFTPWSVFREWAAPLGIGGFGGCDAVLDRSAWAVAKAILPNRPFFFARDSVAQLVRAKW
jgi:hypothetical protein